MSALWSTDAQALDTALAHLHAKLDRVASAPSPAALVRLEAPFSVTHLPAWLDAQTLLPRLYWRSRETGSIAYAAVGAAHEVASLEELRAAQAKPGSTATDYFGGTAFDAAAAPWPGFGACRFVLPRVVVAVSAEKTTLALNLRFDDTSRALEIARARDVLAQLVAARPLPRWTPTAFERFDTPDRATWCRWVEEATTTNALAQLPKVVLSRQTHLACIAPPSPWALLARWQARAPHCFHLGAQFTQEKTLIACSPERLYRREQRSLTSEALAGTWPRWVRGHERRDTQALLADAKNDGENRWVQADIAKRLAPLATRLDVAQAEVVTLPSLYHLRRRINATLTTDVDDTTLLKTLPPTPAVGGVPRDQALAFIRAHESHARGWYSGAFGRISRNSSELAVTLRSALVNTKGIYLHAGAGIVAGSRPEAEWAELDHKIADIMALLGIA